MGLIRVLLALAVVIAHSGSVFGFKLVGGIIAVETFYIISGFYMALILNEKYIHENGAYSLFVTNRFLRIFPVYWSVLVLTVGFSLARGVYSHGNDWGRLQPWVASFSQLRWDTLGLLAFANVFIFFQDVVMFLGAGKSGQLFFTTNYWNSSPPLHSLLLVPQAWTIALELCFYLVAPLIVRRRLRFIVALMAVSLSVRYALIRIRLVDDPWSYRFLPKELFFFLLGVVAYRGYKFIENRPIGTIYLNGIWASMAAFTLFFSQCANPRKANIFYLSFFMALPFIFLRTRDVTFDARLGELSYPIYLSHFLVISLLATAGLSPTGTFEITVIIGTLVMSILLNELVSKKIERKRQQRLSSN